MVSAPDRAVGGNADDVQLIDLVEFFSLGQSRAGHSRQLLVEAEVVLERDSGQRAILALYLHPFFGLDSLVQTLAVAPSLQHASSELINDQHLAVADDVILVES